VKKLGSCTLLAWILWLHNFETLGSQHKDFWNTIAGYETEQQCDKETPLTLTLFEQFLRKKHPELKITVKGETLEALWANGMLTASTFICLPDTVDPRPGQNHD
jgi:hypothetical protein